MSTHICNTGIIGCKKSVDEKDFNRSSRLCTACIPIYAKEYGINPEDVSWITLTNKNESHYFNFKGADKLGLRERVRILMLAMGKMVHLVTDRETKGAEWLKPKIPWTIPTPQANGESIPAHLLPKPGDTGKRYDTEREG
jgi:hypothetical protein